MSFASLPFLFLFLPVFIVAYFVTPTRHRNDVALAFSLFYYAWGAPKFVALVVLLAAVDLWLSRKIAALGDDRAADRKTLLFVAVAVNLAVLFHFKYSTFFGGELNHFLRLLGQPSRTWTKVVLPIGVSFITFEEISYLVDVYRRTARPAPRFRTYLLFLLLFPHSIAGPIFRWNYMEEQLEKRKTSLDKFLDGVIRFSFGLGKKVLLANALGVVADAIFAMPPRGMPVSYAWVGMVSYSLQLFFDFSGYSDMAIGLGKMIGFDLQENFNRPFQASSVTDFWRRWHISLTQWMRDYLYISLGGNRRSTRRTYFNLCIVLVVSGVWHGANWTFLVWGIYHGVFLILDRLFWLRVSERLPRAVNVALTCFIVMLGFVVFRSDTLTGAVHFIGRMFAFETVNQVVPSTPWPQIMTNRSLVALAVGALFAILPLPRLRERGFESTSPSRSRLIALYCFALVVLLLSFVNLTNATYNPFIYFRF